MQEQGVNVVIMRKGKKPTKYFLNLEKRNWENKTIKKLVTDSGSTLTEPNEILTEE